MASSLTGISIASSYDSLLKVGDNDGLSATLQVISDGLGTETGISLNNAGDLTATGTITANSLVGDLSGNISGNTTVSGTLTFGSLSDGTLTMTDILDEDNMSSDSATALATQQSIKAYVDAQVTASDLDFQGDAGGQQSIDLDSEVLSIVGTTNEIQTNSTGNSLTISLNPNISGLTSVAATTFTGALTGNASTATTLETSRNIAGVAFNGSSDISLTTDNITEGSNLYYTSARFDSALSAKSTTDLSEGTNLYYTDARADARVNLQTGANLDLSSKSTTDLSEGSNLYYTDTRADGRIALQVGANLDLSSKNTDNLSEGSTNLYFTDERVDDRVASLVVAGTSISATYDDVANSLTIANTAPDQTVALTGGTGITTSGTYPNFTITNDSPDQTVSLTGSNGLTSGGTYPSLTIAGDDATTSTKGVASFSSDHFSVTSGAVSLAADSIDDTLIDFGTGAGQVNTDDLPEGSTNLFFTQERTDDAVNNLLVAGSGIGLTYDDINNTLTIASTASGLALTDFSAATSGIGSLSYNNTTGVYTYVGPSKTEIDGLGIAASTAATLATARTINGTSFDGSANISFDTDSVSEGVSNLYYTTARFDTAFSGKSTTDLSEGTNLYYTSTRANSDFDTRLATKSTTDLAEGTNLYYTDARFDTRLGTKTTDNLTEGVTNLYNQTHTGDVTGSVALTIASDAVTYDKMQDLVTANRVLGGTAAGTIAEVQVVTDMIADDAVDTAKLGVEFTTASAETSAAAMTIDTDSAEVFTWTAGHSATLSFTNVVIGKTKTLQITGGGGSYTLAFGNINGSTGTFNKIGGDYDDTSSTKNLIQIKFISTTEAWYTISQIA